MKLFLISQDNEQKEKRTAVMQLVYRLSFTRLTFASFFINKHNLNCINILDKS